MIERKRRNACVLRRECLRVCVHAYMRMLEHGGCTYTHIHMYTRRDIVRTYMRYRIRQFAIYCLDFNLPSEWPWALPPLPTDIRRRKLPIVSMELDSYCAPTFMPAARERTSKCTNSYNTYTHIRHTRTRAHTQTRFHARRQQCDKTRVRFFGKPTSRTLRDLRRSGFNQLRLGLGLIR